MSPTDDDRWAPKVHPLTRAVEAEDPMELMAEPVVGDPAVMLECILQEFLWMGWTPEQLLGLFHDPGYPVLGELRHYYGDEAIRRQLEAMVSHWGVLQFRETIVEGEEEPELVQITLSEKE